MGAAATTVLAGCGPTVFLYEETESDSVADTDSDTDVDPTTTVECINGSECQPGYECIDNVCIPYDYYCGDGGDCCYEYCCYDECCYGECYYSECYSDEECGPLGLCNTNYGYGECQVAEPLPNCELGPELVAQQLPSSGNDTFISMAFVDANGDAMDDLVVGREGALELHVGPGGAPPIALPVPPDALVVDTVSGDVDGDGDSDLIASTLDGRLFVLVNDGLGGFGLLLDQPVGSMLFDLQAIQWNGDGTLDLAGVTEGGQAALHLGSGMGDFVANATLPTYGLATSMTRTNYVTDAYDDLWIQDDVTGQLFLGDFSGDLTLDNVLNGAYHGQRELLSANINLVDSDDVVGVTPKEGWVLLETWPDGDVGPYFLALEGLDPGWMTDVGDFDGDTVPDVVVGTGETLSFALGDPNAQSLLGCVVQYFNGIPIQAIAAGDFDGNGRSDVAFDGGGVVTVLLSQ